DWPPLGKKWFDRAAASYGQGDVEDAQVAVDNALRVLPHEPEVRLLASRIALARLEYERSIELLAGLESTDALAIRGRSYWYAGRLDEAADELERLVADPEVRDGWARDVVHLARRGAGRKPFQMSGGMVAVTEMPQVSSTALVVPLEVNGEPALGLIATATPEAVIDSSRGSSEPTWISLRFGERIEVKDVPALAKDLSGLSRHLNAPIKVLLGVNLLRHLHPTFDFTGGQFVVRNYEPPPPPQATTVRLSYVRGGGMLLRGAFGAEQNAPMASLLVDTSMNVPVALDVAGWKKAGVNANSLRAVPNMSGLRHGVLPMLRLGAFEIPQVPGVEGGPIAEFEKELGMELDGLVGSRLLAAFRVTLVDDGLTMWLEDMPAEAVMRQKRPLEMPANVEPDADEEEPPPPAPPGKPGKAPAKPGAAPPAAAPGGQSAPPSGPGAGGPASNRPRN
ncbi:MAG TPA: hypothetical protein VK524_26635, partial [Polyangiaceae bacterium]|nr:hypothetical protein [Polyangiaceae bacterium]